MQPPMSASLSPESPLLDAETVVALQVLEAARPGLLSDLTRKFESARLLQLDELRELLAQGDSVRAATLIHSLRGGAASLGLQRLADALDLTESNLPVDAHVVTELTQLLRDSVESLRNRFTKPAPAT